MEVAGISVARKSVLLVLFVPSVQRDGITPVDQGYWVGEALETLGTVFGGATAYPRAKGIWRDDERGGHLVHDDPVVIHPIRRQSRLKTRSRLRSWGLSAVVWVVKPDRAK
jgi:hypothetical protein